MSSPRDRSRKVLLLGGAGLLLTLTALGTAAWALVRAEGARSRQHAVDAARSYAQELLTGLAHTEAAFHPGPWVVLDASQHVVSPAPSRPFAVPPPVTDRAAAWALDRAEQGADVSLDGALELAFVSEDAAVRLRAAVLASRRGRDAGACLARAALPAALLETREGAWLALTAGAGGARERVLRRIGSDDDDAAAALLLGTSPDGRDADAEIRRRRTDLSRAALLVALFQSAPAVDVSTPDRVLLEWDGRAFVAATERPRSARDVDGAAWWLARLPEGDVEDVATRQKRPYVWLADRDDPVEGETVTLPGSAGARIVAIEPPEASSTLIVAGFAVAAAAALLAFAAFARAVLRESRLARLRSEFVATVGHELRTPVAVIRSAAEALALGRARSDDDRERLVGGIVRESERLSALLGNVLDFARMESGRAAFELAETDAGEVVRGAVATHRAALERAGVSVEVEIADVPPVRMDRDAVSAAVVNLLDNAAKFGGGHAVGVRVARDGDQVAISVADHGPGVPDAEKPRVFQRFFRGAGDVVRDTRGTGIGLALVRHAAEAHGGRVDVTDTPGGGATFRIVLPVAGPGEG